MKNGVFVIFRKNPENRKIAIFIYKMYAKNAKICKNVIKLRKSRNAIIIAHAAGCRFASQTQVPAVHFGRYEKRHVTKQKFFEHGAFQIKSFIFESQMNVTKCHHLTTAIKGNH